MAKTKIPGEYLKDSVVRFTAKAGENITKGQSVYISGISGEVPVVSLADADDTNKMPAFGLAESTVSTNGSIEVTSNGTLAGIDTSSYALGDILYISTTAGSLTNDPSGLEASKVQNIGMVQRVHASNGSIKVGGAGRTNATPNLNDGNIFVGNSSNKSVSDAFTDVLNDQAGINSSANATAITIDSSENVGIGTTSPNSYANFTTLTLDGTTGSEIDLEAGAVKRGALYAISTEVGLQTSSATNLPLTFGTNGTERMRIDSSGNVGIGTSSPTADLSVGSTSTSSGDVHLRTTKTAFSITPSNTDAGGILLDLGWVSGGQGPMKFGIGSAEKMRIDSSGNVGIGTSSPSAKLTVAGGSDMGIRIISDADGYASLQFGDVDDSVRGGITYNSADDSLQLRGYNNTERMRIASNGQVLLTAAHPSIQFTDSSDNSDAYIQADGGTLRFFADDNNEVGSSFQSFHIDGSEKMRIDSSGRVGIGTASPATSTKGLHVVHDATEGTPSFPSGEVIIAQRNFNSSQGCHIGIIGGSAGDSAINFGDKDNSDAGIIRYHHNGDFLGFTTNTTEHWKMLANGSFQPTQQHTKDIGGVNAEVRNIYAQGLYVGGSGSANKLDDYEEGTWTPALGPGSGQSYGNRSGHYTKVGRMVTAYFGARLTAGTFTGGEATITGLPFAVHTTGSYQEPQFVIYTLGGAPTGQTNGLNNGAYLPGQVSFYLGGGESKGRGRKYSANADQVLDANEVFDSNSFIKGIVTYYTS